MWLGISLAVGFSVAVIAICYFAVAERESGDAPLLGVPPADGRSGAMPPARPASVEQVVFEIERHIDAELAAIAGDVDARLAHVFEPKRPGRTG